MPARGLALQGFGAEGGRTLWRRGTRCAVKTGGGARTDGDVVLGAEHAFGWLGDGGMLAWLARGMTGSGGREEAVMRVANGAREENDSGVAPGTERSRFEASGLRFFPVPRAGSYDAAKVTLIKRSGERSAALAAYP